MTMGGTVAIPWTERCSLVAAWERTVAARPDHTFLLFEAPSGRVDEWTYAEFDAVLARVAARLAGLGVEPGTAVHLALTNSPTFVAVWLATARLGAWVVPSDPMGRVPELADHIARTRPVVGLCAAARADVYHAAIAAAPAAGAPPAVVEIDEADTTLACFGGRVHDVWPAPALTDRAAVMFTSGTTGRPKGVEVTQANYAFAGATMAAASGLLPDDRQIVVLPLFHANAQYYSFAPAIWTGASVALVHSFSAGGFLPQCARLDATCASLFAAPMRMILARGGPVAGVRLRHCWFAQNLAADQYETLAGWFGCRPRQLYGMTETIPAVLTDKAAAPRPDSMGFVTAGCGVDVHDRAGRPAAPGVEGDLVVRGEPGLTLFAGYLDDPATTAASFRDGWFVTGDRARRDASGQFFFAGRRSDLLKVAGENVSTVEVEQCLSAHPKVLEAAVIGVADAVRDEVPVAFVVAADRSDPPGADELLAWAEDALGKAKRPRQIVFLDELPRTSVGKIRKFLLPELLDASATTRPAEVNR